jgi:uncharacterized protein YndB with AHSA1/START domain
METNLQTQITRDVTNRVLNITRTFEASVEQVWQAWTDPELLALWWAPRPWKTVTRSMDFTEGGTWLYAMEGPEEQTHFARADFKTIKPLESFICTVAFCDQDGTVNQSLPVVKWECQFSETVIGTILHIYLTFHSEGELEQLLSMGFEEGFTTAHSQLDELLNEWQIDSL